LGVIFYNIFLWLFRIGIHIASLFHPKARKWVKGRKNILRRIRESVNGPVIWMHCASLGEFEQGRPLLEAIRGQYPGYRLLLTFFSPSGYEVRKNYAGADWVFYLPMDGPRNARLFLEAVQPQLVIFVKYEFWYYYLKKIKYRQIPLLLVSALFWKKMSFFRWYGAMPRKMLSRFDRLFVQDAHSLQLMEEIGLGPITQVSGDTRFDRVSAIAVQAPANAALEAFARNRKLVVAGSTWPDDEAILAESYRQLQPSSLALVLAPHEIDESHLEAIEARFPGIIRYSKLQKLLENSSAQSPGAELKEALASPFLLIDNIGLLSQLYRYAWVTYVGGGFGKGIHNTLEAAVYGKPVFFGPVHHKFREAREQLAAGGAFSIRNAGELSEKLRLFHANESAYAQSAAASREYVSSHVGATNIIMQYIQENRLLTKLSN
jgi:3-deoxy-D-manno-octulosonic-acid transferase